MKRKQEDTEEFNKRSNHILSDFESMERRMRDAPPNPLWQVLEAQVIYY